MSLEKLGHIGYTVCVLEVCPKMASIEHRFNEKKQIDQYRARYRWKDETGKIKCSKTAWFNTINQARKNADELTKRKELDSTIKITSKRNAYIYEVYKGMYLEELKEKAFRDTTERSTTDMSRYKVSRTIITYHTPEGVKYTKASEITPAMWREWLAFINNKDLSGATVDKYKDQLIKFNRWLADNGFYTDLSAEMNNYMALQRTQTKTRKQGERKDRYLISAADLGKIVRYFREQDLGVFKNFYFYTLFYVLFYTCMRKEEARALQWKNVDLREDERIIYIKNAIPEGEKESNAINRTKKGIYYCKNEESVRGIPILDIIYQLLKDYKESYKFESGLDDIDECFVFPRELKYNKFDWSMFDGPGYWLIKYKEALSATGLPNTDIGYLRHSGASFLIAPEPDGLNFDYNQIKSYMGHVDDRMLRSIYARLQDQQRTQKMKETFKNLYTPKENKKETENLKDKQRALDMVKSGAEEQRIYMRKTRILSQITHSIAAGKTEYLYKEEDADIIEELKPLFNIEFKQE